MRTGTDRGFSLIELMVVVAVVSILAAVAYPSYIDSVRRGHRSDGKAALLDTAQRLERYFTENTKYSGASLVTSNSQYIAADISPEKYYSIAFDAAPTSATVCGTPSTSSPSDTAYRLCATPIGAQSSDSCGVLSLSSTGARTPTTERCWSSIAEEQIRYAGQANRKQQTARSPQWTPGFVYFLILSVF